jgi:hypothetical protein
LPDGYTVGLSSEPTTLPSIVERLRTEPSVVAAELRPPRAELETRASMDAWIDTYHAVRSLTREGTPVFLTDSAVGLKEEDNLRHLVSNLGTEVSRRGVVPFLTCKHPLEYCTAYADRAVQNGFQALVVLGGDKERGTAAVPRARWQLRERSGSISRSCCSEAGPTRHADTVRQIAHLLDEHATAEFYLTQIARITVTTDVARLRRGGRTAGGSRFPGVFGVFTIVPRTRVRSTRSRVSCRSRFGS